MATKSSPLHDFISLIKKNNIARTNRYRISFSLPPSVTGDAKSLALTCLIADIPGRTNSADQFEAGNYARKIVNGREYTNFTTTFLVTGKYAEKNLFDSWFNAIHDESQHAVRFYDDYIASVTVECLNEQDQTVYVFELLEAFPMSVSQIKLDRTAQNQQTVIDVDWAFHKIIYGNEQKPGVPNGSKNGLIPGVASLSGKNRLLPIPGLDSMSAAVQSAVQTVQGFREQVQGVLKVANDVREQVRDFKMAALDGVKTLNGVVKDFKAIAHVPADVKNEVIAVVNDTKNQLGSLKSDVKNFSKYPSK